MRGHGPFRGRRAAPLAAAGRQAPALQLATPILVSLAALAGALVMALAAPRAASAQIVNFRHYTTAEGMPQSQVLAVEQDRLGYMWFGTYGGLTRFDGGEYRTYTKGDGLTSNAVWDIVEDEKGRLLLATSGGLCIRDAERFECLRQSDGLVDDDARSVASDGAGGVWVGTARGLSHVSGGKIRNYTKADGLPSDRVRRIVVDARRRVWLATEKGLAHLEGARFVHDSPDVIGDTAVQFITPMGDDLLVGVGRRLFVRSDTALTPVAAGMIPDSALVIDGAVDSDGTIWVATRDGALRIRNGQVDQLRRQNGLLSDLLIRVLIDREHDVWFGTESGASKHVPGPFRTYTDLEGLPHPFVRAIGADAQGRLWTGGRNGIAVREGERFRAVPLPGVPDNRVYALAAAPGGGMLIGTRRGLIWYNEGRITVYREEDGMPGQVPFGLQPDGHGGVWVGTERGLARWENGKVTPVTDRPALAGLNIISLTQDRRGRLWIGRTSGGVVIMDRDSVRFLGPAEGFTDQTVWAMQEDSHGRMWVGTNGDGAMVVDGDVIRRYTTREGLASDFIWQILSDSRGDVWLFGNLGLDRFTGEKLTHYGRGSGLIELEGSAGAAFEDRDRNLWFGTGLGIVRYNADLAIARTVPPPVFVEEATVDGTPLPLVGGAPLALDGGSVRIRFASPSYRDETSTRFRYRLRGVSDAWSVPTADRSISYAGLAPGSYVFEVVAANGPLSSAKPATLAFEVLPSFWQTWWFRVLAVSVLLGGAAVVPSLRARALERERRRLEGIIAQHTRELAEKNHRLEQSNRDLEHFAYVASHDLQEPLRKIRAFSDRVSSQYAEKLDEQGRDYLGRMGNAAARMQRLIDDLLCLSRVSTKKNAIEPIELDALAQEVLGDLEIRIQSTNGRVELGALPRIAGDPVQMRQIFQNLIGNALKFHRPDESPVVKVTSARRDEGTVEITFEDNGIGFESKDAERVFMPFLRLHGRTQFEGTGIGLTICQKIAERHGGSIRAESVPGRGSRFVVTLPIHGPAAEPWGERHAAA